MNLIDSFNLLLAQRHVMLSSFQCMPKNIEDNTQSLMVILKMIQQKKDAEWPLLNANTCDEIVDAFETDVFYCPTDKMVILSLLLQLHYKAQPVKQSGIVQALFASTIIDVGHYSPAFALMASQLNLDKVNFTASNKTPEQIQQYILFCIYRGKRLKRADGIDSLNISRWLKNNGEEGYIHRGILGLTKNVDGQHKRTVKTLWGILSIRLLP